MAGERRDPKKWGDTTSKQGEISRVFVGNTDPKMTTCEDLESKFSPYGHIQGIDINANGFSFVQFPTVQEAQRAVQGENGTILRGRKIEVRIFDKSGPPKKKNMMSRDRSRSPVPRGSMGPGSRVFTPPPQGGGGGNGPMGFGGPSGIGPGPGPGQVMNFGPGQQPSIAPGNDVEIIVINKDQWAYAEMIERKLRSETPIKYVDLLFLHSPQHITMTLNDLFERRTLYAMVVAPINEEHKSITLHILHNQTEHRNMPIDDATALINRDFRGYTGRDQPGAGPVSGPGPGPGPGPGLSINRGPAPGHDAEPFRNNSFNNEPVFGMTARNDGLVGGDTGYGSQQVQERRVAANGATFSTSLTSAVSSSVEKRLPEEIVYLLRTTLAEGGVQFLSLQQIDSIIEYFSRERDRLTAQSARQQQPQIQNQNQNLNQNQNQPQFQQAYADDQYQHQQGHRPQLGSASGPMGGGGASQPPDYILDNPQVKAALNSLLQIGAIGGSSVSGSGNLGSLASSLMGSLSGTKASSANEGPSSGGYRGSEAPSYLSTSAPTGSGSLPPSHQMLGLTGTQGRVGSSGGHSQGPLRRHPLLGTELGSGLGSNLGGGGGGGSGGGGGGGGGGPGGHMRGAYSGSFQGSGHRY